MAAKYSYVGEKPDTQARDAAEILLPDGHVAAMGHLPFVPSGGTGLNGAKTYMPDAVNASGDRMLTYVFEARTLANSQIATALHKHYASFRTINSEFVGAIESARAAGVQFNDYDRAVIQMVRDDLRTRANTVKDNPDYARAMARLDNVAAIVNNVPNAGPAAPATTPANSVSPGSGANTSAGSPPPSFPAAAASLSAAPASFDERVRTQYEKLVKDFTDNLTGVQRQHFNEYMNAHVKAAPAGSDGKVDTSFYVSPAQVKRENEALHALQSTLKGPAVHNFARLQNFARELEKEPVNLRAGRVMQMEKDFVSSMDGGQREAWERLKKPGQNDSVEGLHKDLENFRKHLPDSQRGAFDRMMSESGGKNNILFNERLHVAPAAEPVAPVPTASAPTAGAPAASKPHEDDVAVKPVTEPEAAITYALGDEPVALAASTSTVDDEAMKAVLAHVADGSLSSKDETDFISNLTAEEELRYALLKDQMQQAPAAAIPVGLNTTPVQARPVQAEPQLRQFSYEMQQPGKYTFSQDVQDVQKMILEFKKLMSAKGVDVSKIDLGNFGGNHDGADGKFGKMTRDSVAEVQRILHELDPNYKVDPNAKIDTNFVKALHDRIEELRKSAPANAPVVASPSSPAAVTTAAAWPERRDQYLQSMDQFYQKLPNNLKELFVDPQGPYPENDYNGKSIMWGVDPRVSMERMGDHNDQIKRFEDSLKSNPALKAEWERLKKESMDVGVSYHKPDDGIALKPLPADGRPGHVLGPLQVGVNYDGTPITVPRDIPERGPPEGEFKNPPLSGEGPAITLPDGTVVHSQSVTSTSTTTVVTEKTGSSTQTWSGSDKHVPVPPPAPPRSEAKRFAADFERELKSTPEGREAYEQMRKDKNGLTHDQIKIIKEVINKLGGSDALNEAHRHDAAHGLRQTASTLDPVMDFLDSFDTSNAMIGHGPTMFANAQEIGEQLGNTEKTHVLQGEPEGVAAMLAALADQTNPGTKFDPATIEGYSVNDPVFTNRPELTGPKAA